MTRLHARDGALVGWARIVMNGARIGAQHRRRGPVITEGKQFPGHSLISGAQPGDPRARPAQVRRWELRPILCANGPRFKKGLKKIGLTGVSFC